MSRTQIRGPQIGNDSVQRDDLDAITAGQAVIKRILPGTGISLSSTGVDAGTGDVTINASKTIGVSVDGAGAVLTVGEKAQITCAWSGTISGWSIDAFPSGSVTWDVWKLSAAVPTIANSIVAAAPPALVANRIATNSTLTGWSTAVTVGDVFVFVITSVATVTKATLTLRAT